ncbi:MAG: DnaJ domain-containing protein [Chloroflexota bacterium]
MTIDADPYRTLGLSRGASIEEIKRAYRRLAKIHHPDAAGEKNVPRFLAIQAAYEQLAGGADGHPAPRRPAGPRKAWEADPGRSDATRRAYGGRARGPAPGGSAAGGSSGASGPSSTGGGPDTAADGGQTRGAGPASGSGPKAGSRPRPAQTRSGRRGMGGPATGRPGGTNAGAGGATTGTGTDAGAPETPPRSSGPRKRNKATLGSTSYDGVDGPFEPDWRGASWYGTTSGTYWTLNPKEYADPRKHGPEYQARARRATRPRADQTAAPGAPEPTEQAEQPEPADRDDAATTAEEPSRPTAGPTHSTRAWWESTAGATGPDPAASASTAAPPRPEPVRRDEPVPPPPDIGRAMSDIGRALTDPTFGGPRGRFARAFLGWLPIAFGASWVIGEITGCGRFAATCTGAVDPIVLVLQIGALLALIALPTVASITAMGAITLLTAAVATAFVLSATGAAADDDSRRAALGGVLLVAWLAGVCIAVMKRLSAPESTTRPVS